MDEEASMRCEETCRGARGPRFVPFESNCSTPLGLFYSRFRCEPLEIFDAALQRNVLVSSKINHPRTRVAVIVLDEKLVPADRTKHLSFEILIRFH